MAQISVTWSILDRPESDKSGSIGYFQDSTTVPMPGDRVVMFPGEEDSYVVEVLYRTFEQPEGSRPRVRIQARAL